MAHTDIHLVDGTYELFRHFHAVPSHRAGELEVGAVRGVVRSVVGMLEAGATHVGVATDHVIESFRNALWPGYKTGAGIPPELWSQFAPLEDALAACGVTVWPMVEHEADDALASAATAAAADPDVRRVHIATPDKDLAQCVRGDRVVQLDRRTGLIRTHDGVIEKFGVPPESIPDWLALVGDSADGFPGLPGWGAKSAAAVLRHWGTLDRIPEHPHRWEVSVRGAATLAATLAEQRELALLFRTLATLATDLPVLPDGVEGLRWTGPTEALPGICGQLDLPDVAERLAVLRRAI